MLVDQIRERLAIWGSGQILDRRFAYVGRSFALSYFSNRADNASL